MAKQPKEATRVDSLDFLDTFEDEAIKVDSLDFLNAFEPIAPTRSEVEKPEPREITPERSVVESTVPALPEISAPEIPQVNIDPVTPVGVAPARPETTIQKPKTIIPKREDVAIVDPVLAPAPEPEIPQADVVPVVPDSVEPEAVSQIETGPLDAYSLKSLTEEDRTQMKRELASVYVTEEQGYEKDHPLYGERAFSNVDATLTKVLSTWNNLPYQDREKIVEGLRRNAEIEKKAQDLRYSDFGDVDTQIPTAGVGEAAGKGIKTAIEQFKMTAPAIQLQAASNQIVDQRNLLSVFDRLDKGEQLPNIVQSLIPEREELPSGAPYGSRRLLSEELDSFGGAPGLTKEQTAINNFGRAYLEASPEEKAQMRAAANEIVTNGTKFVEEMIPEINRFLKATVDLRKGVPRLNEVKSAKDVAALFSYYGTQGLAQIAPLVITGAATKSKSAVVSLAGTMNLGGSVTQRFNYLMNAFKSIESTDEKAEALIEYLEKTGDDTLKQAILNTGLDSFFGVVGQATKAKYAKELGKGTVKQQAKEVAKQVGSEAVTEGTQEFIDTATAVKLRETKNALFSKKTFADVLEAALAGGLGAGAFKTVEIPTGIGLRKTVETYKDSRVKAVLDGIFDRLTPKEKEFVNAQNEAGTSPSETLDLLQITFGQKKDPTRVLDPDGNEIADAIGSENAKDITEFVNANKKITEEVENGNYTEQEADAIADKVFSLIEQEGMTGDAAFAQAKKEADDARGGEEQESSGLYDTQIYDEEGKPVLTQEQDKKEVEDSRLETPSDGRVPEVNNIRYEEDIPDEKWLNSKKKIDEKLGRDEYGRLKNLNSSITGQFKDVTGGNSKTAILELPVTLLQDLPGWANEHIRLQDVEQHTSSDTKTFADMRNDWDTVKRYPIDIRVDSDGNARVYEGNHRLTLAKELGQTSVPVLVTYHAVNPKKAQEGFTPEELLFTHKKYNKEKQAQAKTQTEEQDQTKEQSSLPVEYADIINDPNINSQAELFSRMAEAAVAREKQAQEQSRTQAQTQTSAQLPPPDLTAYGDAAPAIEAANLEANRIADEEQGVPLPNPEEIPSPTEAEVRSTERIIENNEALADPSKPNYTVDEYFNADPDNPESSLFERMSILPNVVSDTKNRADIFKYIDNLDVRKWTPVLATLPTDDLSRLFEFKTRNILNFKDGVDENHLSNVSEVVRDLNREQGETIKRYAPLIESWSDFIKKSHVSAREYRDKVKNGKVIKGARSRGVQLSRVMNLSRRLKVDPSKQTYEALTTPTIDTSTGEVLTDSKILNLLEEQKLALANPNATVNLITSISKELAGRRRDIRELYDQWEDLTDSPYGQQAADIYTGTLQAYREIFDTYEQVLVDNIKSLGVDQKSANKLVEDIQKSFAEKRISEPVYIQAVRNGDYYVRIPKTLSLKGTNTKVPGTRGTVFLNSPGEVKDFKRRIAEIYEVDVTNSKELRSGSVANYISDVKEDDPGGLLQRIINAIDESTTVNSKEGKQNLKDMVGQIWLQSLPASNVKVLFGSRREGTFGESDDILQGFANTIKSVSNQFPRIRNANRMRNEVSAAREQITGVPNQEALEKIITEVEKRINLELTPPGGVAHAIARGANKFTFAYLLSSPKTGLVQLTQYPLVMAPILNEYFGESVGYATTKATVLRYLAFPNTLGFGKLLDLDQNNPGRMEWPSVVLSRYIQGTGPGTLHRRILVEAGAYSSNAQQQADEFVAFMKYAWTQADQAGVLRQTYGSDLGGGLTLPSVYEPGVKAGVNRGAAFMFDLMTGLFSNMERLNRELSFMSAAELAYREAKKQGLVGQARDAQALSRAFEATREGALDFTNFNKPRFMKETAVGVTTFQFTSFTLLMQSVLARRAYRAMALMDKRYTWRDRRAAVETFVTIQLGTAVLAGTDKMYGGTPLALFIFGTSVALMGLLTSMDEEYEERTKKDRARAAKLLEVQKRYEKWLSLPDSVRERVKIPPQLTQSEMDELIILKSVDSAKLWRKAMEDHPRYSGLLNLNDYFRDIVLPNYIGVGGKVSDYFNIGADSRMNLLSVLKDGAPAYYGADISRNTSLSNIFYSDLPPDPNPGVYDMAVYTAQNFNILPALSTFTYMADAGKAAFEKDWRKFFKSTPRFYSAPAEQTFLKKEGAENYAGVPLRDFNSDYYTAGKLIFGAGGFSDKFVSDLKNAIYKDNKFVAIVQQDRQDILNEWKDLMGGLLKGALKIGIDKLTLADAGDTDLFSPEIYDQVDPDFLDKLNELKLKVEDFNLTYSDLIDGQYIDDLTLDKVESNRLAKIFTAYVSNGLLNSEDSPLNNLIKLQRLKGTINLFPKGTSQEEMTKRFDEVEAKLNSQYEEYILEAREKQKRLIEQGVLDKNGSPFITP